MTHFLRGLALVTTLMGSFFSLAGDFRMCSLWLVLSVGALWLSATALEFGRGR